MDTKEHTTYKGVKIYSLRNARNGGNKIQMRDIATTYIADKWSDGGEAVRSANSLARAHAMIDWLLANDATVVNERIVTTLENFDHCHFGDTVQGIEGHWIYMKGTAQ